MPIPTRRAILARLALGETSVLKIAEPFEMSLPAVSKHLKVLERAGLITRTREAQLRPCRIEARALKEATTGSRSIVGSGKSASTASTTISEHCREATTENEQDDHSNPQGNKQRNGRRHGRKK